MARDHQITPGCRVFRMCQLMIIAFMFNICSMVSASNLITAPSNINVYLGEFATFACGASLQGLDGIYWLVTEQQTLAERLEEFYQATTWYEDDSGTRTRYLRLIGTADTNNTVVKCFVNYPNGDDIRSQTVYLRVQGLPDSPGNFVSTVMDGHLLSLTWTPPSVLLGTSVQLYRVTFSNDSQIVSVITTSQLNVTIDLCVLDNQCILNCNFSAFVTSINPVGEGEATSINILVQQFLCDGDIDDTLGSPEQLTVTSEEGSIFVSWLGPTNPSSLFVWHYSVEIFDMEEFVNSFVANTSNQTFFFEYEDLGINTCNKSYHIVISVSGVNVAGRGEAANTTLTIQQNMDSCPTVPVTTTINHEGIIAETVTMSILTTNLPQINQDLMIIAVTSASALLLLIFIVITIIVILLAKCYYVKKRNKDEFMYVENNVSYGDASVLTNNPCYEKPHMYEEIGQQGPIYSTISDVKF